MLRGRGAKPVVGEASRNRVGSTLEVPPPSGQAAWDGPAVAAAVAGSSQSVWRVLRKKGVCPGASVCDASAPTSSSRQGRPIRPACS